MPIIYGTKLINNEIPIIENKYSIVLPTDYATFLNECNGMKVGDLYACDIPSNDIENRFVSFDALFGVGFINDNFDLYDINDDYLDEISFIDSSIIIGVDPGDNFYVLVNNKTDKGIYYWDRTHLHTTCRPEKHYFEEVNECGNLYKVFESFDVFYQSILKFTQVA